MPGAVTRPPGSRGAFDGVAAASSCRDRTIAIRSQNEGLDATDEFPKRTKQLSSIRINLFASGLSVPRPHRRAVRGRSDHRAGRRRLPGSGRRAPRPKALRRRARASRADGDCSSHCSTTRRALTAMLRVPRAVTALAVPRRPPDLDNSELPGPRRACDWHSDLDGVRVRRVRARDVGRGCWNRERVTI